MTEQKETFEEFRARKDEELQPYLRDTFDGDDAKLIACTEALIGMDVDGVLVPHGVGGNGRALLAALAARLALRNAQLNPSTPEEYRALGDHLNTLKREQLETEDQTEAKQKFLKLLHERREALDARIAARGDAPSKEETKASQFSDLVHEKAIEVEAIGDDGWFEFSDQSILEDFVQRVMQEWLPVMLEGTEVSVDVDYMFGTEGRRLFGTVTCAQEHQGHNGIILLVQEPEPNWRHWRTVDGIDGDGDAIWTGRFDAQGQCMISSTLDGIIISNGARIAFIGPNELTVREDKDARVALASLRTCIRMLGQECRRTSVRSGPIEMRGMLIEASNKLNEWSKDNG